MMPSASRKTATAEPGAVCRLTVPSPVGALTLFEQDGALTDLLWAVSDRLRNGRPTALLAEARAQLEAYFAGRLRHFDLPLAPAGSAFQRRVWTAIAEIPHGRTVTYGELARTLASAPRAVGGACGANPIPILIPCHRVLATGGALNGYSGQGGLATKKRLLDLEGALEGKSASS